MALKQLLLAYCLISLSLSAHVTSSIYEYTPEPNPEKQKPKPNEYLPGANPEKQKAKANEYLPGPKPEKQKPKPIEYLPGANPEKQKAEEKLFTAIGVQGVVYCKSGSKLTPIQGAVVRVTCLTTDENGYESAPFSLLSDKTNGNGYFLATFDISELEGTGKRSLCKAFIDASPVETCDLPTDVNKGMSGAPLGPHRLLAHKLMKLYSVGPFVYTTQPHSVGKGY